MKKALETEALDAPRLVVLVEDDEVVECVVVGDNKYILCHSTSITSSLLDLLIVYYVTDLSYPRQYSQLLGLLQQYVLKEARAAPEDRAAGALAVQQHVYHQQERVSPAGSV